MTCQEGALLIGDTRAAPIVRHPKIKAPLVHSSEDTVSFDAMELCASQTSDGAVKALAYYLSTMIGHVRDTFTPADSTAQEVILTGVITVVPDPLENSDKASWEMLVVENHVDVDNVAIAAHELLTTPADRLETVLLYTRSLMRFTGAYPGVVVKIKGKVFTYDVHGAPTAVGVTDIAFPSRPPMKQGTPNTSDASNPTPARVHFLAGPFPRNHFEPLAHAIRTAAQRGACALVLYGPFVAEAEAKDTTTLLGRTFDDSLNQMLDDVEAALSAPEVKTSSLARVYLVPSLKDINNFPVLPQPKFGIEETMDAYKVVSNPCTVHVGGLVIKCCNYPSICKTAEVMAERWNNNQRLLRAGECVLRDRLLAPLLGFPPQQIDVTCLPSLALMDDLELNPPHAVVFSSSRDHAFAFVSHSEGQDLSDPRPEGAAVIMLPTKGRTITNGTYSYEVVEMTVPDVLAASTGGLGGGNSTVTILNQTCPIDLENV